MTVINRYYVAMILHVLRDSRASPINFYQLNSLRSSWSTGRSLDNENDHEEDSKSKRRRKNIYQKYLPVINLAMNDQGRSIYRSVPIDATDFTVMAIYCGSHSTNRIKRYIFSSRVSLFLSD